MGWPTPTDGVRVWVEWEVECSQHLANQRNDLAAVTDADITTLAFSGHLTPTCSLRSVRPHRPSSLHRGKSVHLICGHESSSRRFFLSYPQGG
jgi:hypothetical protein